MTSPDNHLADDRDIGFLTANSIHQSDHLVISELLALRRVAEAANRYLAAAYITTENDLRAAIAALPKASP